MTTPMTALPKVGISGIASYFPRRCVDLEDWSEWTDSNWDKIKAVVGSSFRIADPREDVYTLSAEAVFSLLKRYDIAPSSVGLLILATESSQDNAVGASTLKGIVDRKLEKDGLPALDRNCETYELKQACLAGIYGIKQALRWAMLMPPGRHAIVVSADIAEYELGSTGEPTQGAGAIATLISQGPKLLEIDPRVAGSSSLDRGTDFRKPHDRPSAPRNPNARPSDFPVFDGPYSTASYLDSVCSAFQALLDCASMKDNRRKGPLSFNRLFFHRPYRQLPERAAATLLAQTLLSSESFPDREVLLRTLLDQPSSEEPTPLNELGKRLHKSELYSNEVAPRLELGKTLTANFGNLYTASLPAWIAAALVEGVEDGSVEEGESWLLVGYGSGDASEALVGRVVPGWREAAASINVREALAGGVNLNKKAYQTLHIHGEVNDHLHPTTYRAPRASDEGMDSVIPTYELR